jgi:iron complex outermembrane receptor protein
MRSIQRSDVQNAVRLVLCAALACGPSQWAAAGQSEPTAIGEVVVTAQKREQNIQDVGIAVTPLGDQALQELNIKTATDLVRAVPSLKMNAYSSSQVVFNIRGVAHNGYGDEQEPPVAVYQDDSYSTSINLASFPVFDLERVEVLRGPQGTLFGRNATGGAIQFISNRPSKEFEGYVSGTYGSYDQMIVEGAISGPFSDQVQGRLAFISNQDDGYIEQLVPGEEDRGANDHYALRGQLAFQPTESTNVNLILRYLRADKERQAGLYSHEPACPNAQRQGEFTPPTYSCPAWNFWSEVDPGDAGTGYQNPDIIPSRGGDPWATEETSPSYVDRKIKAATLRIDSAIGNLDFVSITDYQEADKFYLEGGDASPVEGVVFYQGSDIKQFSEELRLSGTFGNNQIVGGLYGMKIDADYTIQFADPFYEEVYLADFGPGFAYIPVITASQETTSYAVFLQNEWKATEKVSLIAGLRYWHDKRKGAYYGDEPSNGIHIAFDHTQVVGINYNGPFDESVVAITLTPEDAHATFDDVTARLELDYRVNDDVLLYASYNRGSKSGGFSFSSGTPFADDPSFGIPLGTDAQFLNGIPFDPEVLDAYEVGIKSTIGGTTTFNASAFYYDYEDYQAFVQLGVNQTIINLPATAYGLEVEINSHPVSGLTLQLGLSAMSSNVEDIILPDSVTEVEHDMPQTPDFSGNALARYEFALGGGTAFVQGDVLYTDNFCFTVLCAPVEKEGSYSVANARIGYGAENGQWQVAAFVDNLTEEEYRVYAFDSSTFAGLVAGVYGKPRIYGVTATWRFGAAYQ